MTKPMYDALALVFSYVFMGLGVALALCGAAWMRSDRRALKASLASSPTPAIGYIRLTDGASARNRVKQNAPIALPIEGYVGASKSCDIHIPAAEVPSRAGRLSLTQAGMLFSPMPRGKVRVNGVEYRVPVLIEEDSRIEWGPLSFQIQLLEGAVNLPAAMPAPTLTTGIVVEEEPIKRRFSVLRSILPKGSRAYDDLEPDTLETNIHTNTTETALMPIKQNQTDPQPIKPIAGDLT